MRAAHILTKSLIVFTILLAVNLICPTKVFAADQGIESSQVISFQINSKGKLLATHLITLSNKSDNLLSRYDWQFPFAKVSEVNIFQDDHPFNVGRQGNNLSFDFRGAPIRPQSNTVLKIEYAVSDVLESTAGLSIFHFAGLQTSEKVAHYEVNVTYPADFPNLVYISQRGLRQTQVGHISFSSTRPGMLVWSDSLFVTLGDNLSVNHKDTEVAANLIPDYVDQDTVYQSLSQFDVLGAEKNGNVWAVLNQGNSLSYQALVRRSFLKPSFNRDLAYKYNSLDLPKEIAAALGSSDTTSRYRLEVLYNFLVDRLQPEVADITSNLSDLAVSAQNYLSTETPRNALTYAYLMSGLLTKLDIPHRIVYGYVWGLEHIGYNTALPHVWLEAGSEGNTTVLDPFLEDISGYNFFDIPNYDRVQMGTWDPDNAMDTVLGLLTDTPKLRPIESVPKPIEQELAIALDAKFPIQSFTLDPYIGKLTVSNHSAHIINIASLHWDGYDITEQAIRINRYLYRALPPLSTTQFEIKPLIFSQLFYDGYYTHELKLTPANPQFDPITTSYNILYIPNSQLALVAGGSLLLIVALGLVIYFRRSLLRKR